MARSPDLGGLLYADVLPVTTFRTPSHQSTVDSVFQNGLLSGKELRAQGIAYVGSFDNPPKDTVWGNIVRPNTTSLLNQNIHAALYDEHNAVFPALAERFGRKIEEYGTMGVDLFSRTISSSFLVICKLSDMSDVRKGEDETGLVTPVVPKEWYHTVVFPEEVAKDIQISPENFSVSIVGNTSRKINGFFGNLEVTLPNYEDTVRNVLSQTVEDIWISGVRLRSS